MNGAAGGDRRGLPLPASRPGEGWADTKPMDGKNVNHPGHVGYPKAADRTPGIRFRFTRSVSGSCELATQVPMRSLRARSLRSLVSITTTRLPER